MLLFDYQSVCHYSKTMAQRTSTVRSFDYQSVCHYSKTVIADFQQFYGFDYQSVCHYSKTCESAGQSDDGLTTSQFVTTPKRNVTLKKRTAV